MTQPSTPMQYLVYFLEMALKNIYSDPPTLSKNIQQALALAKDLDGYLEQYTSPSLDEKFNQLLHELSEKTKTTHWELLYEQGKTQKKLNPVMLTGPYEGRLLRMLAQLIKAKHILEIGMFTGYSALMMASVLPKEGYLITCEDEPFLIEFAQSFFDASPYGQRIKSRLGKALEVLKKLAQEKKTFDMIFLDANKSEYIDYYLAIKQGNLLAPGGIICADNTLMKGLVYSSKAKKTLPAKSINRFNQLLAHDPDVEQIILPVRDGLSIIRLLSTCISSKNTR